MMNGDVTCTAAAAAPAPPGQPPHHLVVVDHQFQHHVQLDVPGEQHLLERLGLRHVPREPVEQEAGLGVVVSEPVGDHRDGDLVRDKVATLHVGLGPAAERGSMAHVVPENVTCRDLRDGQVRREGLGLCPLARTRGAHEDDTHYRRKPS